MIPLRAAQFAQAAKCAFLLSGPKSPRGTIELPGVKLGPALVQQGRQFKRARKQLVQHEMGNLVLIDIAEPARPV